MNPEQAQFTNPRLKGITVQQPLADAMILGKKRVEGRSFNTKMPKRGITSPKPQTPNSKP